MAISSFQLQRFTAFEDVNVTASPGLNVFIGANSTGKSHLLKVLYAPLKVLSDPMASRRVDTGARVRAKLISVFLPEDDKPGRLVRGGGEARGAAGVTIRDGARSLWLTLSAEGELGIQTAQPLEPTPCLFLPSREFLAGYEGFIAAYQGRELSFDETYYDLCVALSAAPLRGARGDAAKELLAPLREALPFEVESESGRFYITVPGEGRFEAHLVAEGFRKLASVVHLINNGALVQNGVVFWDEPEASLNPVMTVHVARLLLALAAQGVQVFVATHDYLLVSEISLAAEYETEPAKAARPRFHSLHRPARGAPVTIESGSVLADLTHNPIFEEFAAHYERERKLFYEEGEA